MLLAGPGLSDSSRLGALAPLKVAGSGGVPIPWIADDPVYGRAAPRRHRPLPDDRVLDSHIREAGHERPSLRCSSRLSAYGPGESFPA